MTPSGWKKGKGRLHGRDDICEDLSGEENVDSDSEEPEWGGVPRAASHRRRKALRRNRLASCVEEVSRQLGLCSVGLEEPSIIWRGRCQGQSWALGRLI